MADLTAELAQLLLLTSTRLTLKQPPKTSLTGSVSKSPSEDGLSSRLVEHGEAQPGEIQSVGYGCDVANEQSVKDTFAKIEAEFGGRIDVSDRDLL